MSEHSFFLEGPLRKHRCLIVAFKEFVDVQNQRGF